MTWVAGSDTDVPALAAFLRPGSVGVVTAATALHWMRDDELFRAVASLTRPGGGFAVVTNGTPLWLLDVPWAHALRDFLQAWIGRPLSSGCGTDDEAQRRYRDNLAAAGFNVSEERVDHTGDMDLDHLVGAVLSTFSSRTPPLADERPRFTEGVRAAVGDGPFPEHVEVGPIFGRHR